MHEVNQFIRTREGEQTLVVWPTNTDDLTDLLVFLARDLGDETLLDSEMPVTYFSGPPTSDFVQIAERTVAALNDGVSLAGLGISEETAEGMAEQSTTIEACLGKVRRAAVAAGDRVKGLLVCERYRLWTVVIAGNDVEGDVAAPTRGGQSFADIDRLMSVTGANVVKELKAQPDQIGILGTVLDARIFHMDMFCVLAVARAYGSNALHAEMKARGMQTNTDATAGDRLRTSELGVILSGQGLGTRKRGQKPGDNTKEAFAKLTEIARQKRRPAERRHWPWTGGLRARLGPRDGEVARHRSQLQERPLLPPRRVAPAAGDDVEGQDGPRRHRELRPRQDQQLRPGHRPAALNRSLRGWPYGSGERSSPGGFA